MDTGELLKKINSLCFKAEEILLECNFKTIDGEKKYSPFTRGVFCGRADLAEEIIDLLKEYGKPEEAQNDRT